MTLRIGEILVEMRACTRQQIADGLRNQVIFGGRIGTNLLEMGAISEEQLAHGLGRRHKTACLFGELEPDPSALALLSSEQVDHCEAVPYLFEQRKLAVLVCDPNDFARLDEVGFITGKQVRSLIVPEARLWYLMRTCYGIGRELRGIELQGGQGRVDPAAGEPGRAGPAQAADLMDEAEFQALYARAARRPGSVLPAEEVLDLTEEVTEVPPEPPPGVLDFGEAMHLLEGVEDRDAVARIVLRYARSRFKRALLLTVHRGVANGWDGLGEGLDRPRVRRIELRLGDRSAIGTVVSTRAHFLGPLQKTPANVRFLKALAGGAPRNSLLVPILVLGRVVNVLYADNGRGGTVDSEVGELLIVATKISQSYEHLLARLARAPDRPGSPGAA